MKRNLLKSLSQNGLDTKGKDLRMKLLKLIMILEEAEAIGAGRKGWML